MDHAELIAEMAYIEKLSTQERLKLARRRRMQQLKKCTQKEREFFSNKKEKTAHNEQKRQKRKNRKIVFACNIMILEAAARNDIDEVRALLETGVNPDSTNEDGLTALHQCCIDDSEEMMRLLVQYGANVNAKDSEKWTPLHAAATCGHLHLAKFLISGGANLLAVNADGNMPYDICEDDTTLDYIEGEMAARGVTQQLIDDTRAEVERQMLQDFKKLKDDGKSLMFRDEQGATPLHIAAANGYIHVVEYLLGQNIPTEVQDNDNWSPMHASACWGHPDVLEMLVQHGGNLQAKTKNQETPYDICEDVELRERILQLINEQETKRLNDQNRRIRRVRSNKRTQSIRRTSVREKTLIPKKEAQEEGRMRLSLENKCFSTSDGESSDSATSPLLKADFDNYEANKLNARNLQFLKEFPSDEKKLDPVLIENDCNEKYDRVINSDVLKSTEIQDVVLALETKELTPCVEKSPNINNSLEEVNEVKKRESDPPAPPPRSSSTILSSSVVAGNNNRENTNANKIDIHVTVTVNPFAPGTLSDLKKQRVMSRASQNSFTLSGGSSVFSLNTSQEIETTSDITPNATVVATSLRPPPPPPSPTQTPRRFCGEPSDFIGKTNRWPCCSIS